MGIEKRVLVDMSATLIHHGHIRLLKNAKNYGKVIIALTTDEEILKKKGYIPELNFNERSEILLSIKYVDEVIPSNWLINDDFLDLHKIDIDIDGDISEVIVDPKAFAEKIANKILLQNIDRIKKARKLGEEFGEAII